MEKLYTLESFNLINFLEEVQEPLRSKITACVHKDGSLVVHFSSVLTSQDETDMVEYVANHDSTAKPGYRIMDLVKDEFQGYEINSIDFKRHLKNDVALDKVVSMLPNGRPEHSIYNYNNVNFAKIRFEIQDNGSLMTSRKEYLAYYKEDGTLGPEALIKSNTLDFTKEFDLSVAVDERVNARKYIVKAMKGYLSGILMQALGKSMGEIVALVTPYWDSCELERRHFEEFGSSDWKDDLVALDVSAMNLAAPDMSVAPYPYLSIDLGEGVTIRDWMVSKLTY